MIVINQIYYSYILVDKKSKYSKFQLSGLLPEDKNSTFSSVRSCGE